MLKKFTTFVITAHLLVIVFLLVPRKQKPQPRKHITVRTLSAKQPPMTIISNGSPKTKGTTSSPSKTQSKAPSQKEVKKGTPSKAPASKPSSKKPIPVEKNKPASPQKKKELSKPAWKEIDEALAKIEESVYPPPSSKLTIPQIKAPSGAFEKGDLVGFLHSSLNLPEFGEVTIELTVKKNGEVARLTVIKSESKKNRAYLEQHLAALRFPLILESEQTFTLTFCNEI